MKNANRAARVLVGCVVLLGATCIQAEDWPQWRGPNRDNKVAGFTEPTTWPKELTKKWSTKVGIGDAGPLLVGDKVYAFGPGRGRRDHSLSGCGHREGSVGG